jgi:hypothetical protein
MSRNVFRARFVGDAFAPRHRAPSHAAARGPESRTGGRAPSPERPDRDRPPIGAEPVPQADGHP